MKPLEAKGPDRDRPGPPPDGSFLKATRGTEPNRKRTTPATAADGTRFRWQGPEIVCFCHFVTLEHFSVGWEEGKQLARKPEGKHML